MGRNELSIVSAVISGSSPESTMTWSYLFLLLPLPLFTSKERGKKEEEGGRGTPSACNTKFPPVRDYLPH